MMLLLALLACLTTLPVLAEPVLAADDHGEASMPARPTKPSPLREYAPTRPNVKKANAGRTSNKAGIPPSLRHTMNTAFGPANRTRHAGTHASTRTSKADYQDLQPRPTASARSGSSAARGGKAVRGKASAHAAAAAAAAGGAVATSAASAGGVLDMLRSIGEAIGYVLIMVLSLGAGVCCLWVTTRLMPKKVEIETD